MKIKNFLSVLFLTALTISCSSSDSSSDSASDEAVLAINGSNVTLSSPLAQRSENTLFISAMASDGSSFNLLFDRFGQLKECSLWGSSNYSNFMHFNSNYFTFNLISVDEAAQRVKVSFSGNLYLDDEDLTSSSKAVSGTFDLPYILQTPSLSGLGLQCKIAGVDWHHTEFWDNGFSGAVDRKYIAADNKQIIMTFAAENIATGSYNFTTTSANRMQLAKYNTTTHSYDVYNTSGSLTITSNTPGLIRIVAGTFSFTATNPSNPADVIQVTNGSFKTNF